MLVYWLTHSSVSYTHLFPTVTHVMIGRGLVADPELARKLRGGKGTDRKELTDFLAALYHGYTDFKQVDQVEPHLPHPLGGSGDLLSLIHI